MDNILQNIPVVQYLRNTVGTTVDSVGAIAEKWNVAPMLFFILGAILALTVALFGYRIVKVLCAVSVATFGFGVGSELFVFLTTKFSLDFLPEFLTYVLAAIVAALFFFLGYKKFNYALFGMAFIMSVDIFMALTGNVTLAMGGALVAALVCVFIIRVVSVLFTAFAGSFLAVAFIGQVLTNVTFLQFATNDLAVIIAAGVGVVCTLVQFIFSRYYYAR